MSDWIQDNAANRIKKSYFNGFIDMSGGELTVRHRGATFGGDVSFGSGVDISGDISTRGDVDISGTLTVTEDLSAHALVAAQQLTVVSNSSFAGVNIGGDLNVGGSITSGGGTLTLEGLSLTGDLESDASISTVNLIVDNSATLNDVSIIGDLIVGGSITSGGGTLTLDGLTLTGDLSAHALISTVNLNVVSDASFGNNVYIDGSLDVAGDVSAGAGAFTGDATAYRSITGVTGVYMGAFGNNAMMNFVSEGASAELLFQSNAGVTTTGNIIYHNESETEPTKKSSFRIAPHYANQNMGLQIQSLANWAAEVSIEEGMLTIKNGLSSSTRNYESLWKTDDVDAELSMNQYPGNDGSTNAYFHIDGADGHDLLLTGHGYSTTGDSTHGFNLYSKQATYAQRSESHGSQGLCIQTSYNDGGATSYDFRLGIGDRPKAYQFLTTRDAKIGGKLDVDGSLNVTDDASFGGDLIVHGAGMFTGSTNINTRNAPAGVYIGNNTDSNTNKQDSIIQMTSTGAYSVIDFTSNVVAEDNHDDFEGRIIYYNGNATTPYRLYLIPKYSNTSAGLMLEPISNTVLIRATVDGDIHVKRDIGVDGSLNVDGTLTVRNTLTIDETGAGTAASATGGSITLSHATSNGTGKNSIVFKSASDSGSDYGYIQYHDDGGGGSGTQNGLLTIGIQNEAVNYGQGTTNQDLIKFDVAGASAYFDAKANATGGNKGTMFKTNYVTFVGLYADALPLATYWNTSLTAYNSGSDENLSALYQYFDNAHDPNDDLAFTGMNAADGSTVDEGAVKPYGYMLRSKSNSYIAYQTRWSDNNDSTSGAGLALGVNALPGKTYDFAVGGKSHFGNNVIVTGDLTVDGAGIFTGVSTNYDDTTSPAGIYIGKYVNTINNITNEYANMQIVSNNDYKKSWIDFVNNGTSETDYEGRIAYYGAGGTTDDISKSFVIHPYGNSGGNLTLTSWGSSAAEAAVDGMLTLQGGVPTNIRNYASASYWDAALNCGNSYNTTNPNRYAAYLYVDNGHTSNADLLLTGHDSGGDFDTVGYNLYSKGAVQAGATDQGLCIQTYYKPSSSTSGTQCFRIGLGNRPGAYQFLTTGHVQVGGNLDICGNLTIAGTNTYTSLQASTLGSTGDLTIDPTGKVHITSSLQVDGTIDFNGDFIKTDTIVRMTEQVDISNDGTGPALKVAQYGSHDVAEFYDDNNLVMIVKNGGDVSFAHGVTVGGDLTVNGVITATSINKTNTYTSGQINDISFSLYSNANGTIFYRTDYGDASAGIYMRIGRNTVETQELIPSMNFVKEGLGDEPMKIAYYARGHGGAAEICNLNTYWNNGTNTASFTIDLFNDTNNTLDRVVEFTNTNGVGTAKFSSSLIFTESQYDVAPRLTNDLSGLLVVTHNPVSGLQGPRVGPGGTFLHAHTTKPTKPGVHMGVFRWQRQNPYSYSPYYQESTAEIDLNSTGYGYYSNAITFWMNRFGTATDGKFVARMLTGVNEQGTASFHLATYGHEWMVCTVAGTGAKSVTFNSPITATSCTTSSDLRLKTDIETIENALDKVCRLRGVSYRFKENYDPESTKSLGMIAQEMEQEFPELVSEFKKDTDGDGEKESYKAISYGGFTAPLLEAIKELKARNDALEAKTPELETKLGSLETTVAAMNARIKALETA